jgi:hypothetical protein
MCGANETRWGPAMKIRPHQFNSLDSGIMQVTTGGKQHDFPKVNNLEFEGIWRHYCIKWFSE